MKAQRTEAQQDKAKKDNIKRLEIQLMFTRSIESFDTLEKEIIKLKSN